VRHFLRQWRGSFWESRGSFWDNCAAVF
jgi:hypothetical protein